MQEDWYSQQYDHEGNTFCFGAPKVWRVFGQCGMGLRGSATSLTLVPALFLFSSATLEEPPDTLALH